MGIAYASFALCSMILDMILGVLLQSSKVVRNQLGKTTSQALLCLPVDVVLLFSAEGRHS